MRRLRSLLILVVLLLGLLPVAAHAQGQSLFWEQLDVDIDVHEDGSFRVAEQNDLNFTSGTFRFGTRSIPTERTTDIRDVQVFVNGQPLAESRGGEVPGTYRVSRVGTSLDIRYFFPEPVTGQQSVRIEYTVDGGLRYYEEGTQLWWKAIWADRPATIEDSLVTVTLPEGTVREQMDAAAYFTDATIDVSADGRVVTYEATDPIPPGQEFEVRVEFPPGVVRGSASPWQEAADQAQAEAEARAARGRIVDLMAGALSLIGLVGGLTSVFLIWYTRGRDRTVELTADYLSEPPDDLPAGVVGTLLDERADLKDVMATLLDLARKGAIRIQETAPAETGLFSSKQADFSYELLDASRATTRAEKKLIEEFFGSKRTRDLDALRNKFYKALPAIQRALYEDVLDAGLFDEHPDRTRGRYTGLGVLLIVLAFAAFCGALFTQELLNSGVLIVCVPAALGLTGLAMAITGQVMPRKSAKGSEAASRWQAFRRYLQNIDRYGNLEEKREIWAEYLPFATAFGLEQGYIRKFARVDAPAPIWYAPYGYGFPPYDTGRARSSGGTGLGTRGDAGGTVQDSFPGRAGSGGVQGLSDSAALGLQGMSTGLASMLSTTASTLTSTPAPSSSGGSSWSGGGGGGFSGGGFSGGGGGGGGSSGFG